MQRPTSAFTNLYNVRVKCKSKSDNVAMLIFDFYMRVLCVIQRAHHMWIEYIDVFQQPIRFSITIFMLDFVLCIALSHCTANVHFSVLSELGQRRKSKNWSDVEKNAMKITIIRKKRRPFGQLRLICLSVGLKCNVTINVLFMVVLFGNSSLQFVCAAGSDEYAHINMQTNSADWPGPMANTAVDGLVCLCAQLETVS